MFETHKRGFLSLANSCSRDNWRELTFADDSIPDYRPQWSQAGRLEEHRVSSSIGRLHAGEKTTTVA
jgi:hypothetical protein